MRLDPGLGKSVPSREEEAAADPSPAMAMSTTARGRGHGRRGWLLPGTLQGGGDDVVARTDAGEGFPLLLRSHSRSE